MDRVSILKPTSVRSSEMRRANCRWSSSKSATVNDISDGKSVGRSVIKSRA